MQIDGVTFTSLVFTVSSKMNDRANYAMSLGTMYQAFSFVYETVKGYKQ